MTDELRARFDRQAEWQHRRAALSWSEKLRLSVVMREVLLALRRSAGQRPLTNKDTSGRVSRAK